MKILMINKFFYKKGGAETYFFSLAEALKKEGHEIVFFSMKHPQNYSCEQDKYFVSNSEYNNKVNILKKIKMFKNFSWSKEAQKKIEKLIVNEKPEIALLSNIHRQLTCSIIPVLKKYKIKIVMTVHDLITICPSYTMLNGKNQICEKCLHGSAFNCVKNKCIKNSHIKSFLGYLENKKCKKENVYNLIDLYICPSNFYKNKLLESKITESPIIQLSNPVTLTTKFELKNGEYFLYIGRLTKEKGLFTLIDAMKKVNSKLLIVGTGLLDTKLKNYIVDNELVNKVQMLGYKTGSELSSIIQNSKAVILPSEWYENGPYSAIEAMAYSKPLIVSNVGGLPEMVDDNINGYVFDILNVEMLSNCINKMQNLSLNDYSSMCLASYKKYKTNYCMENYVKSLINYILKL